MKRVLEYARKFDSLEGDSFTLSAADWHAAESRVTPEFHAAIETAAKNIREYAALQLPRETWTDFPMAGGWARWCGRSIRWARTFPLAVIRCRRHC